MDSEMEELTDQEKEEYANILLQLKNLITNK